MNLESKVENKEYAETCLEEKKRPTHIVALIDESFSMKDFRGSMNESIISIVNIYNEFIEDQKKNEGDTFLTLVMFNNKSRKIINCQNIKEVKNLETKDYFPNCSTAFLQTVKDTIDECPEGFRYIFMTLSDGDDTSSVSLEWTEEKKKFAEEVKKLVEKKKNEKWEFISLATGLESAVAAASSFECIGLDSIPCCYDSVSSITRQLSRAVSSFANSSVEEGSEIIRQTTSQMNLS
jgi:hypothetical protein